MVKDGKSGKLVKIKKDLAKSNEAAKKNMLDKPKKKKRKGRILNAILIFIMSVNVLLS